jgi:hypothetical protein
MQQFRPLTSFQDEVDVADADIFIEDTQFEPVQQNIISGPLFFITSQTPRVSTEELTAIADQFSPTSEEPGALSLIAALQSTLGQDTNGRIVVIPGEKKRKKAVEKHTPARRIMSTRLRHGIVLSVVLFVLVSTLVSLSPLASGQGGFRAFADFGNWVRLQAFNWQIQSHDAPASQQPVTQQNNPVPPPMSLPKSQYIAIAQQDASAAGISPVYFVRQINQESGFNPYAVSPAGAVGIAQFLPGTAAGLGINPWDPIQALRGAAQLMASYARNYGGDYAKALAAYNGGAGTVQYAVNACGAAYWMNCLPYETRHYIYVIMGI